MKLWVKCQGTNAKRVHTRFALVPWQNVWTQGPSAQSSSRVQGRAHAQNMAWILGKKCVHIGTQLKIVPEHCLRSFELDIY